MVSCGNHCQATFTDVRRSSLVCASAPRIMSRPMRSHGCSMGFRSGESAGQRRMSNPTQSGFIREKYPMSFDDPGMMSMTPLQASGLMLSGQRYLCCWYPVHVTALHAICCLWFGWTQIHLLVGATGSGCHLPWRKGLEQSAVDWPVWALWRAPVRTISSSM
ncbi:hypothetical protein TNCV_427511 [Trichonephila clavipes]|nr:hypothetical protein TNCV_427511 [Trichonephila clavipes]